MGIIIKENVGESGDRVSGNLEIRDQDFVERTSNTVDTGDHLTSVGVRQASPFSVIAMN